MNHILASQLSTLHTDHIDYYLLHSLTKASLGEDEEAWGTGIS